MSSGKEDQSTTAILRAAHSGALHDTRTRETVIAAARGIAERTGVPLLNVEADGDTVEVTVEGPSILAIGLLAELRRATEQWYATHHEATLWSRGCEENDA